MARFLLVCIMGMEPLYSKKNTMKANFQLFVLFSEFITEHLLVCAHSSFIIILNTHFSHSMLSIYLSFLEVT